MIKNRYCFLLFLILFIYSLSVFAGEAVNYPPEVTKILEKAGDNRSNLEEIISHYTELGDSLKLKALNYLLSNMESHNYLIYDLVDSSGTVIEFNVLDYPDFDTMIAFLDSIEDQRGELDFKKRDKIEDVETITADFLMKNLDYAFDAWRMKPWARELSFEDFCEYILPYRGSSEPLEPWREYFWRKYKGIEDKMSDPTDPVEAASIINDDIRSWFKFDSRYYLHPTDQGLSEMLETRKGRCEDMTNLTIFAMRSNGLAVTSDYTPYWANTGNNHAWNAIVTPQGKVIPFMGAECNPGKYRLPNKLAKVYRKMFSIQKESLGAQGIEMDELPPYIKGRSYIDVTREYVDVCDVKINLQKEVPDSVEFAYLCVFNSGEWKAIQWGRIENGAVTFKDMGMDIAYIQALYKDKKIIPSGSPFILNPDSSVRELTGEPDKTGSVKLVSTTRRKQEVSTDGIARVYLTPGKEYELQYWNDGWQSLGKSVAGEEPLLFESVPQGCLYWLVEEDSNREERIFTYENGEQVWW